MSRPAVPVATVPRSGRGGRRLKKARGFSLGEFREVGLQGSRAHTIGLRVDFRRRTVHGHNVSALKEFLPATHETDVAQPTAEKLPEEAEGGEESAPEEKEIKLRRSGRAKRQQP